MDDTTQILQQLRISSKQTAADLLPVVYEELRKLAARELARESSNQTLEPTALVHEAYLRLTKGTQAVPWTDTRHFVTSAALAMRRILVENARRKGRVKRGGGMNQKEYREADVIAKTGLQPEELLTLDEALSELAEHDQLAAQLVTLRYFSGLPLIQAADVLQIPPRRAKRLWAYAKAWLLRKLKNDA